MRRFLGTVLVGAALCAPPVAFAQTPGIAKAGPQQPPPQKPIAPAEPAWSVEEIVVRPSSPRLWKLVKGGSTVWILGFIEPVPRKLQWNSGQVARVIAGSDRVLLPPNGSVGLFEAIGAMMRSRQPNKGSLDATLPPDLAAAYRATLVRLGRDPSDHQHDKLAWAAMMLRIDLFRSGGLVSFEPINTVRSIAREKNVPVSQIATYRAGATLKEMLDLPEERGEAAVRDSVSGVNFALDHAAIAGAAWAKGDLATVRANVRSDTSFTSLLRQTASFKELEARGVDDTVRAVNEALDKPGVTFVVLALPNLVRREGALDRLRGEGVTITEPSE